MKRENNAGSIFFLCMSWNRDLENNMGSQSESTSQELDPSFDS